MAQQQNNQNQAPIPDAIISVATPAGSNKRGAIVGNIVFSGNRGNTKNGQPYKAHQLSLNVEALQASIADGSLKVSKSGIVYFNFVSLDDNAKAKIAQNRANKQQSGGGQGQQQASWGKQNNKAF